MKILSLTFTGLFLSVLTILIRSFRIENGDMNAISMYITVFFVPSIILSLLNAIYINLINKDSRLIFLILFALIPILLLIGIGFNRNLTIPFFDIGLSFTAKIASIALGFTNLIWVLRSFTSKKLQNK